MLLSAVFNVHTFIIMELLIIGWFSSISLAITVSVPIALIRSVFIEAIVDEWIVFFVPGAVIILISLFNGYYLISILQVRSKHVKQIRKISENK